MSNITSVMGRLFRRRVDEDAQLALGAIDVVLNLASEDLSLLQLEYYITNATGTWLDEWGSWFGISREYLEIDDLYRGRILGSISTSKATIPAIIAAIKAYAGDPYADIQIYEPFNNLASHNHSSYSGVDHYPDSVYWRSAVIEVRTTVPLTSALRDVIERTKSGGIKVYYVKISEVNATNGALKVTPSTENVETYTDIVSEMSLPAKNTASTYSTITGARSGRNTLLLWTSILKDLIGLLWTDNSGYQSSWVTDSAKYSDLTKNTVAFPLYPVSSDRYSDLNRAIYVPGATPVSESLRYSDVTLVWGYNHTLGYTTTSADVLKYKDLSKVYMVASSESEIVASDRYYINLVPYVAGANPVTEELRISDIAQVYDIPVLNAGSSKTISSVQDYIVTDIPNDPYTCSSVESFSS